MRIPSPLDSHVKAFCRQVAPSNKPTYVPVQPLPNKPPNECFSIVPEHIARHGGKQLIGWNILEWKKVLIEAEFHAVWQRPDGTLVDITPKGTMMGEILDIKKILFLPDPSCQYTGVFVDNIRKPLRNDPRIRRFCDLLHERATELNKGDLADKYGEIPIEDIPPDIVARIREIDQEVAQLEHELIRAYGKR